MKHLTLSSAILLIACLSPADIYGREKPVQTTGPGNTAEFTLTYDFTVPGDTSKIEFTVVVPHTIPDRQKILIQYSPSPGKTFNENGNHYAVFVFNKPQKQFKVEMNIKAEMFEYDLSTAKAKQNKSLSKGPSFESFLKNEKYIEKNDDRIRQVAKSIEGSTDLEMVEKIYNYVIDNMDYGQYNPEPIGAAEALKQKKGDCTEYAQLFVALCRAKDIPARVVSGYITKFDVTPKHDWTEVYLKEFGWVPFDPTLGDVKSTSVRADLFQHLKPVYISCTHFINDVVLNNNTNYWYRYWGDEVELKSSIEFKKSPPSASNAAEQPQ